MARKKENLKKIDVRPRVTGGGSLLNQEIPEVPPAIVSGIPEPTNLTIVSQTVANSAQLPQKYVNLTWDGSEHISVDNYLIESSLYSDFSIVEVNQSSVTSAAILTDVGKTYYFRVRAVVRTTYSDYSNVVSTLITPDTTLPPDITVASAEFNGGALVISYVEPAGSIYKNARIRIYNAARTVLYGTFYSTGGRFVWSEAENITASTSGVTSVSVDINSVSWSNVNGTALTLTATLTAPNAVTSVTTDFTTGNLVINWINPNNAQYKYVSVKLYNSGSMTTLYREYQTVGQSVNYTYVDNLKDTANLGDNSIYYTITVVSWLGLSSTVVSDTAYKALPLNPTSVNTSWFGDNGTESADLYIEWEAASNVKGYRLSINGFIIDTTATHYTYTFNNNEVNNGTNGDPSLELIVYSVDQLNKLSTGVASTETNAAPTLDDVSHNELTNFGDYNVLLQIPSTIKDLKYIEYALFSGTVAGGILLTIVTTPSSAYSFSQLTEGYYQVRIALVDQFEQRSTYITGTQLYVKAFNLDEFRQELSTYNSSGTLMQSLLKDGITVVSESPVNYLTYGSTTWDYYTSVRPTLDRYGAITIAGTTSASMYLVFATSQDNATWQYWYYNNGTSGGEPLLVSAASLGVAQASTVSIAAATNFKYNFVFPVTVEARYIKTYIRMASGTLKLTELYPRRLLQADDIRGQTITGDLVAANTLTGNNIVGTTLSAIKTFTGTLEINQGGYVRAGMTGFNTGNAGYFLGYSGTTPVFAVGNPSGTNMTWDGTTLSLIGGNFIIKTQNSGNRVEINSSGFYGYNSSNTLQVQIKSSDGTLTWGASLGELGSNGIRVDTGSDSTLTVLGSSSPLSLISVIDSIRDDLGSYILTATSGGTKTNVASIGAKRLSHVYGYTNSEPPSPVGKRYNVTYISSPTVTVNGVYYEGLISLNAQTIVSTLNASTLNVSTANLRNINGTIKITGSLGINADPSINLAIGDSDTGFSSAGDGDVTIYANAQPIAKFALNTYPGFYIDPSSINSGGSLNYGLRFGAYGSGEGISSARNAGNFNQFGIDFYTGYNLRGYFTSSGPFNVLYGASLASVALGTASNNRIPIVTMRGAVSNDMQLEFATYRFAAGTDWTTSTFIAQRKVDATYQRYISWGLNGIGIGVLNPAYALEVAGDAAKDVGSAWATRSDIKTKKNITKISDGMNKILELPDLIEFEYNGLYGSLKDGRRHLGFIANELVKVDRRLVSEKMIPATEGAKPEAVLFFNPDPIHFWSVNALKELHSRVKYLEDLVYKYQLT